MDSRRKLLPLALTLVGATLPAEDAHAKTKTKKSTVTEKQLKSAKSHVLIATVQTKAHGPVELMCFGSPPRCSVIRKKDGAQATAAITLAQQTPGREIYQIDAPFIDHAQLEINNGAVFKGPFLRGSAVLVNEVDQCGAPCMKTLVSTTDAMGAYRMPHLGGVSIVEARGLFFDEATGEPSERPLRLRAVVASNAKPDINVESHLCARRIVALRTSISFANAARQAKLELANSLDDYGFDLESDFELSTTLAYAARQLATLRGRDAVTTLQQLLDALAHQLGARGALDSSLLALLRGARDRIDLEKARARFDGYREIVGGLSPFRN